MSRIRLLLNKTLDKSIGIQGNTIRIDRDGASNKYEMTGLLTLLSQTGSKKVLLSELINSNQLLLR